MIQKTSVIRVVLLAILILFGCNSKGIEIRKVGKEKRDGIYTVVVDYATGIDKPDHLEYYQLPEAEIGGV